jgi:hypothetical protein
MSGGLTDRNDTPFGTWQHRFIDWFRDIGFMQKPGVETKAALDVANRVANPPAPRGGGAGRQGGQGRQGQPPAGTAAPSTVPAGRGN